MNGIVLGTCLLNQKAHCSATINKCNAKVVFTDKRKILFCCHV